MIIGEYREALALALEVSAREEAIIQAIQVRIEAPVESGTEHNSLQIDAVLQGAHLHHSISTDDAELNSMGVLEEYTSRKSEGENRDE